MVKLLFGRGAQVDVKTKEGHAPLDISVVVGASTRMGWYRNNQKKTPATQN